MGRLVESNKQVSAPSVTEPDTQIIYYAASYIQYERIRLNKLYKQYSKTVLLFKKGFRTVLSESLLKKSYELSSGSQLYKISFAAVNRQVDWLKISLVLVGTISDSYNAELDSTVLGKVKVQNITNIHSLANDLEFDLIGKYQKHQT